MLSSKRARSDEYEQELTCLVNEEMNIPKQILGSWYYEDMSSEDNETIVEGNLIFYLYLIAINLVLLLF